jgi:citronellol/citronellal dehydrogenase
VAQECEGRVAFVTGASRGIGAAIAERLAAAGARVAAVARTLDEPRPKAPGTLRETVARIEARGGLAVAIPADVLDDATLEAAVARCRAELGAIEILVNNAACGPYRPFEKQDARDFATTFDGNVRAPFALAQRIVPDMRARGRGWIVNVSSATAERPAGPPFAAWERHGGHQLYASSKAALNRLSVALAAELEGSGIAVNTLAPVAAVLTASVEALGIQRWLEPEMIEPVEAMAEATLALCTCDASFTGRVTYSLPLLREWGREIRTLDGTAPYRA